MLPSQNRLKNSRDFNEVYDQGLHLRGEFGKLILLKKDDSNHKIGIVVPAKVGNAVERNHAKRLIREVWRELLEEKLVTLPYNLYITYIVWNGKFEYIEIYEELEDLLENGLANLDEK